MITKEMKIFRDRFRNLVKELGVHWIKCPKIMGITKATFLGSYELGIIPCTKALKRIANFFGVSISYLLGLSNVKENNK